jgi:tetratricopeptide (TPR) repeat protein
LAAFMQLSSGRINVEPVQNPATANVMTTIDVALQMADAEPPPIEPSLPAEAGEVPPQSVRPGVAAPVLGLDSAVGELHLPLSQASPLLSRPTAGGKADATKPALAVAVRRGISPLTAMFLVVLAVMQGLVVVVIWRALSASDEQAADGESTPATPAPATVRTPARSAPVASTGALGAASPPPSTVSSAADGAFPTADGSGQKAPSCDDSWKESVPREGSYPGAAFAKSREANRWITRGDVDKAQHAYCLAVRWDSQNVEYLVGLGHLFLLRRDAERAAPLFERALTLAPDSSRAHGFLGDALARTGDYDRAKQSWLRSSGREQGDDAALQALAKRDLGRGESHLRRREWVHAERMFRRAAVMSPETLAAAVGLSRSLTGQAEPKPAMVWAKYAVSRDPRHAEARLALGDALAKLGDAVGATVEWREALLLNPADQSASQRLRGQ